MVNDCSTKISLNFNRLRNRGTIQYSKFGIYKISLYFKHLREKLEK
nr:MAG TPA: hypothetical protein [Caudoviricetes sp.]